MWGYRERGKWWRNSWAVWFFLIAAIFYRFGAGWFTIFDQSKEANYWVSRCRSLVLTGRHLYIIFTWINFQVVYGLVEIFLLRCLVILISYHLLTEKLLFFNSLKFGNHGLLSSFGSCYKIHFSTVIKHRRDARLI